MKQAIVVRTDLGMGTGKLAAQVAHASLRAADAAPETDSSAWRDGGAKKVVLTADSDAQLFRLAEAADRAGLPNAVIRDAGHTQLDPNTVTALGVGPAGEAAVDEVTGDLSLL
jgi:PTH2 family peptidyl-tRNA hydrolase